MEGKILASDLSSEPKFRLADRLAAARQGRFVGREAELQLFRSTLLALRALKPRPLSQGIEPAG